MNRIFLRELKGFLALLTPQQLKVFQLYYIENNGYSGIGRELNISRQIVEMLYKSIKLKPGKIDSVDLVNNLDTIDSIFQVKGIMISIPEFKAELSRRSIASDINEVRVLYKLLKNKEIYFIEDRYILNESTLNINKYIIKSFQEKRILSLTDISVCLRNQKIYSLLGLEELLNKNPNIVEFKGFYIYAK
ncbi:MAG: hypothetical protein ACRC4S_00010, partial [Cetobacterium sp.]